MTERPTSFRIAPVTEVDDELEELLGKTLMIDGRPANIFGVLAKHPKLLKRFNLLGGFILNKGLLPIREREIVILRVGANCVSRYEFGQHTVIGRRCGLTDDEITALLRPADAAPLLLLRVDPAQGCRFPTGHLVAGGGVNSRNQVGLGFRSRRK